MRTYAKNFLALLKLFVTLTKSKKGIIFHAPSGRKFITSVAWMKMLCEDRANGGMITLNELTSASDSGIAQTEVKQKDQVDFGGL